MQYTLCCGRSKGGRSFGDNLVHNCRQFMSDDFNPHSPCLTALLYICWIDSAFCIRISFSMVVMKFGGSSVKTAAAMRSVAALVIRHRNRRPLVILSACGGITDKLLATADAASRADRPAMHNALVAIREHHVSLIHELSLDGNELQSCIEKTEELLSELEEYSEGIALLCECTPRSLDMMASFGERLSTTIFSYFLCSQGMKAAFHDARETMRTNAEFTRATADQQALSYTVHAVLQPLLTTHDCVVSQGFIGSTIEGYTTTLGRGGSDLSAALYGAALGAEEIQIWTDVSGVLSADPRIVPNTNSIPLISFSEMRQLAYFGAKVLHPDTIKPAVDTAIPVRILNTFEPEHQGTTVVADEHPDIVSYQGVRAASLLKGCVVVQAEVGMHEHATAVLASILRTCSEHNTEVLLCFAEEAALGLVIRSSSEHLLSGHQRRIRPCEVLCICGPHLSGTNVHARVSELLTAFNAEIIISGMSDVGIIALLAPNVALQALQAVHSALIEHNV